MRRYLLLAATLVVVVVLAIGLTQIGGKDRSDESLIDRVEAGQRLAGAQPRLAAIHAESNEILGGGTKAFQKRIDELKGLPIVVNVWGEWCDPCKREMPILNRASAKYGKRVAFLGVDTLDNTDDAKRFLAEIPVSYPSYEDGKGDIAGIFNLLATPSTIFYDRRGRETVHQGEYKSDGDLLRDITRYALSG
ncbi:MAG TPA: TlpA disulfide reductase family protein [Baekduia sp.]|nr:TlpA disulfide reductase family protein [Baekduia sp.]